MKECLYVFRASPYYRMIKELTCYISTAVSNRDRDSAWRANHRLQWWHCSKCQGLGESPSIAASFAKDFPQF